MINEKYVYIDYNVEYETLDCLLINYLKSLFCSFNNLCKYCTLFFDYLFNGVK